MEAFISIIVPIYKIKEQYLKQCIDSLIGQTFSDIKIILIDDGSPDNCGQVCDEYAASDNRITVIHQKNQGVSVARNAGIKIAKTEWITFVDPDDWVEVTMVGKLYKLVSSIDADIIMYDYCREYQTRSKYEFMRETNGFCRKNLLQYIRLAPLNRFIVDGKVQTYTVNAIWNKMYKLSFIHRLSLQFIPEARKGQDRLFNTEALDKTDKIYYFHELFYHYRCNNESITNRYNPQTIKNSEVALAIFERWITDNNKPLDYTSAYITRVCTRLYEYMRLYYFNRENDESYRTIKNKIVDLISRDPYKKALENVKYSSLTKEEKIFIFCIKNKFIFICKMLVNARIFLIHITGNRTVNNKKIK